MSSLCGKRCRTKRQVLLKPPMKKLHRQLARPTSLTAGERIKKHHKKIRIMAGNMPTYFPDQHLEQRDPSEPIHTCLNIPRFWLCRREFQHWAVSCSQQSSRAGGHWRNCQTSSFCPKPCSFSRCLQSWGSSLCSLPSSAPQSPPKAGRVRGNAESRLLLHCQHSASLEMLILVVDFLFICCSRSYVKHLVCWCDSLEVLLAALSRASHPTDQKLKTFAIAKDHRIWLKHQGIFGDCLGEGENYMLKHKNSLPA